MKYLVFGTILSGLLSELQIIIPETDRNGVCIGMVNSTLSLEPALKESIARPLALLCLLLCL
jgi:hypothetical protein